MRTHELIRRLSPGPLALLVGALVLGPGGGLSAQHQGSGAEDPGGSDADEQEEGPLLLQSDDGTLEITLGGRVQPRYEVERPAVGESTSSFFLRRVRLDVRGTLFTDQLTFRFMPELAGEPSLRDGWLDYAFDPRLQVRAGQIVVPFHWHRAMSGSRQHFAERSRPAETFGFPTGYDAGVLLHGQNPGNTVSYGVGVFDGSGRNVGTSNSSGNMASSRVGWAVTGELPDEEPDLAHSPEPQMALGLGLQGALRNEARAWDLGRSVEGDGRGDYLAVTADVSLRWRGLSGYTEGYVRRVRPEARAVASYEGRAYSVGAGYFVAAERVELVARHSDLRLDRDEPLTEERQWGAGVNVYHSDHAWKTHVQLLRTTDATGARNVLLAQLHLQF